MNSKQNDPERKRDFEKEIVKNMIEIYCKGNHKNETICYDCQALYNYVDTRIEKCPFMETKTFCSVCPVHCYNQEMRIKIKQVMKYAGPRMLFVHPILTVNHGIQTVKFKIKSLYKGV